MFIINIADLKPSELEGMLRLFFDSDAIGHRSYDHLMQAYAAICGDEDLAKVMEEIRGNAKSQTTT